MKKSIFSATCVLACSAVFAQAPASPASPSAVSPASPTSPASKEAMPPAGAGMKRGDAMNAGGAGMDMGTTGKADKGHMGAMGDMHMGMGKTMDANGDGMISKKEFDRHHEAMWKKMKTKNGMVSVADMESMMMQGNKN
jgi:hypothetical protein